LEKIAIEESFHRTFRLVNEISVVRVFSNVRKNHSVVDGLSNVSDPYQDPSSGQEAWIIIEERSFI
jgi:hypothetical protein